MRNPKPVHILVKFTVADLAKAYLARTQWTSGLLTICLKKAMNSSSESVVPPLHNSDSCEVYKLPTVDPPIPLLSLQSTPQYRCFWGWRYWENGGIGSHK